jgi:hypothetical protein
LAVHLLLQTPKFLHCLRVFALDPGLLFRGFW